MKRKNIYHRIEWQTQPIFGLGDYEDDSVFTVQGLLDAAVRQKRILNATVPACCILDPDGDLVRYLVQTDQGSKSDVWPCYHTDLYLFHHAGQEYGVVGCAVGAPTPSSLPRSCSPWAACFSYRSPQRGFSTMR